MISIIIPSFNEQDNIVRTYKTIEGILRSTKIEFEVIFVDDGSVDNTYVNIAKLTKTKGNVRGISFSRNFGKESAIFAGLEAASGECAVIMDCDLQHPPTLLPQMYELWQNGYEVVEAVKSDRGKESIFHRLCANGFYGIISGLTKIDMKNASDFKLLDRKAVDSLLLMPERAPFFRALSSWIGYKTVQIPFEVQEREIGTSKWNFFSLIKYALRNITSFSGAPMQIVTILGWLMFVLALGFTSEALYRYFSGTAVEGFTTVIILLCWIGSILMISLGIIGHYISRIYEEIKARPRYIVSKRCGYETVCSKND